MQKMDFTPEEQLIRKECFRWRGETWKLIQEKKWDEIQPNPCPSGQCMVCLTDNTSYPPLLYLLLTYPSEFTPTIQAVIERFYGTLTPNQWYRLLLETKCPLNKLRYFIERNMIDINNGDYPYTIFALFTLYYKCNTLALWDYLLSDEVGYNINIQDDEGENALLSYLRYIYHYKENYDLSEQQEKFLVRYNENILYLLEKGADPLLEDKTGISALEYVRSSNTFTPQEKERIIQLMERYT